MFQAPPPRRTLRNLLLGAGALLLLVIGLWFGGHPSWLPSPLRSAFVSESKTQRLENQVYGLLTRDYYRKLSRTTLVNDGLAGAVASLDDPYSRYYDPSNYQNFQDTTTNPQDDGGIGVGVAGFTKTGVVVGEAYPGSPAAKAGIGTGDVILAANGHTFAGHTQSYAVNLIRGKVGTTVMLRVRHGHATRMVSVKRADVDVPVASSALLHHAGVKIGYVDLTQFSENAGAEVRAQVQKMRRRGARALILDLRDNGGGLLEQAVATASIFIQSGTIVSTDGRSIPRQVYLAKGDAIPASIPLVVLVNRDTASSAEIVSAALQQRGRATLVGTHTYGKGVFQEIQPLLNGGALDFTVGEYFTPDGENLGAGGTSKTPSGRWVKRGPGIAPNVEVGGAAHQLAVAERVAVSKLK
ncbi:MAG TPA: S41 family peptidase [Solirubrobacteraceae bacterium]|nr:S41 family peptidase [Solirubrobacteraceae bacterium]